MFVSLSKLDDLDAPPPSASNRCIQAPPGSPTCAPDLVITATCRPEGSHLCSDLLTLRYSPEALAAKPARTLERPFGYDRLKPPFARLEAALT
jgi:hypothetical protein